MSDTLSEVHQQDTSERSYMGRVSHQVMGGRGGGYRGRKVVTVHPQHAATKNTAGDLFFSYISNEETQMKKLNCYKGDIYLKISGQLSLNSFYDVHIII